MAEYTCPRCGGCGHVRLTGVYADTLELLAAQDGEVCAAQLARMAGCKGAAMANRLQALAAMGLALCRPYGRQKLWRAAQ